jgi:hypothetical protein
LSRGPHSAVTDLAISTGITCKPAPTASASSPSFAAPTISDSAIVAASDATTSTGTLAPARLAW